jgi:hypothetical protein
MPGTRTRPLATALLALALASPAAAQQAATRAVAPAAPGVTTPQAFFGHEIGADYVLPDYRDLVGYWRKLAAESDRMKLVEIGRTAEDRPQYMAIVTSPANQRDLERYRGIAGRLARAEGLTDAQARALSKEGKAVVWIDGGLHATEVLGAQQLMETVYQLVSRDDPETRRILDDVIVLAVHANPDGMELVSDWYMREEDPLQRSLSDLPRLYQKYVGHDDNRDFFLSSQPETENMNRVLFRTWYPQIVYNHHQTGPTGTVMFAPPFRDPFNYHYDPLLVDELDLVGAAMHTRFEAEEMPGVTQRRGSNYSTWWNGGLRTVTYFHNMVGLLTETIGSPTPMHVPFVPDRQLPNGDLPNPIAPQAWHFRRSIDYSVTANYAVLDLASRYRDAFLYNIYRMGRNSIERGSRDSWTVSPHRLEAVREAMAAELNGAGGDPVMRSGGLLGRAPGPEASARYDSLLHLPADRDPRGYVIPADQPDLPRAVRFVDALLETGVDVLRATSDFTAGGKRYPAGSFVVRTAQAFRPHVLDMFEPQDHPNDFLYEGGPPIPPYDIAGWTLAYQFGIRFDRVLDGFDGPFEKITDWNVAPPAGTVADSRAGWYLSPRYVDGYAAAVRLMREGVAVHRLRAAGPEGVEAGSWYVPAGRGTRARLERVARETGLSFTAAGRTPAGAVRLRLPRIALWDRYGGSIPSGWTRWILDRQGIPYDVVYPGRLDAGGLRKSYDVVVLPDGAVPSGGRSARDGGPDPASIPAEYRGRLGSVTVERTVPELRRFLEAGGTVVAIGGSTALARHLGLPIGDALVDSAGTPLPSTEFYVPGSILRARVDPSRPVAYGMDGEADFFFDSSPAFVVGPEARAVGIRAVAWYDSARPLRSGWAWGQERLQGAAAVVEAPVGRGTLYLFGPEILFRAQPEGTFNLFFNALSWAGR